MVVRSENFIQKIVQLLHEKKVAVEIDKDGYLICKSQEFVQFGRSQMPYVTLRIENDELVLKVSTGVGVTARIAYSYGFEFLKSWNESHPGMAAHLSHDAIPLCRFAFTPPTTLRGLKIFVNDVLCLKCVEAVNFARSSAKERGSIWIERGTNHGNYGVSRCV